MRYLQEKYGGWALVTGASAGIGEAFARYIAAAGMNVILVARRKEKLEKLAEEIQTANNVRALPVPLDLTDDDFLEKLTEKIADREIGLLVNNAGFGSVGLYTQNDAQREADMVKFAKFIPDPASCDSQLDLGFEIVDTTRERAETETAEAKAA